MRAAIGYATARPAAAQIEAAVHAMNTALHLADNATNEPESGEPRRDPVLSGRQHEVLRLLATGRTTRQIATRLHVTEHTIKTHLNHIYRALGAVNGSHAVLLADPRRARPLALRHALGQARAWRVPVLCRPSSRQVHRSV